MTIANDTTSLIIIQPTPFCNIDCSYCYLKERSDRTRLDLDRLRTMLERLFTFPTLSERVTLVWHAGEPLVMGIGYYEAAFACIRDLCPSHLVVDHAIQTNGLLLNDAWCTLFKAWNVGVGISIDGPKAIHDAARKTRSGQGTFDKAVAGLKVLQKNEVPFFVISVLTKASLLDPAGMFDFYQSLGITDVGFNIEEQEGDHLTSSLAAIDDELVTSFLRAFTDLMEARQFPIAIRELEETLAAIQGVGESVPVSNQLAPFGIISIDVRGDVYTFSPELVGYSATDFPTFSIGNIFRDTFDEMQASPVLRDMAAHIDAGVARCQAECTYFKVCGGGAPSNKIFENGSFATTETMYCRLTKKRVTDFVLETLEDRFRL